jgi:signal transduction histidine kinase
LFSELIEYFFKYSTKGTPINIELKSSPDESKWLFGMDALISKPTRSGTGEWGFPETFKHEKDEEQEIRPGHDLYILRLICENYNGNLIVSSQENARFSVNVILPIE